MWQWKQRCKEDDELSWYSQGRSLNINLWSTFKTMPEEYMGDVIGDINSRRGRIEGMEDIGGGKMIRGYVPLSEMFGYATDLRSRTQGRGNYSMFFEKYEQVPKSVQEKILSKKD